MSQQQTDKLDKHDTEDNIRQYLTFTVAAEMYGVDIACTKEIIEYGKLTAVPLMPDFVSGVLNLRGRVVPIIDLAVRFDKPPTAITKRSCIVIIEVGDDAQDVGILVDGVSEVLEIANGTIEVAPNFGAKIRADFISGMARMEQGFLILLRIDKVLSIEEMAVLTDLAKQTA